MNAYKTLHWLRRHKEPVPDTYWLQHTLDGTRNGNYHLVRVGREVECLLDTGSSVLVLKMLRKLKLQTPKIMGERKGFITDWIVRY